MKTLSATHELDSLLAHKEWLFRLARHLVHGDHAEDVAQETWVAALRSPPEPGRPPRPWLAEVLRNFVRKRARTEMRRSGREAAVGEMATTSASPEELYERVEQQQRLVERVMALEEPERRIVLMRYFEDRSATEIAQHLGIPAGTVRWRLKEALEGLRHQLDREHGGDRRAWGALLLPMAGALPSVPKAADTKAALEAGTKALAQGNSWAVAKAVAVAAVIVIVVGGIHVARRPAARPTVKPDVAAARARFLPFDGLARPASAVIARGIVHAPDGTSVAGAMVSAVRVGEDGAAARQPPVSVVSDRDGRFGFSLAPGSYVLAATAPRFAASAGVGVEARDGQSPLETRLTLRPDGFVLSGAAVDSGGGFIPNAELRVRLPDEGWAVVRADLSGALAVRLPRGEYQFVVAGDGYAPLRGSVSLIGDQERSFRLDPAGRISGRVVNQKASGDARAAGAMVRADRVGTPGEPEMAVADDEGNFGFSALNPGT
ncbi:MAG TPA: sigma-70 family RNA polymerase sigma factor, partial [Polyangia bacterium]